MCEATNPLTEQYSSTPLLVYITNIWNDREIVWKTTFLDRETRQIGICLCPSPVTLIFTTQQAEQHFD